jgi:hypothetical protein
LPPTSLGNFDSYLVTLTRKARPFYTVITRVKLEKATNKDGISFSRATFSRAGDVPVEKIAGLKAYIEDLKVFMRAVEIAEDDYAVDVNDVEADTSSSESEPF